MFPFSRSSTNEVKPKMGPPMWRFYILIILLIIGGVLKIRSTFFPTPTIQNSTFQTSNLSPEFQTILTRVNRHLLIHPSQTPTITTLQEIDPLRAENEVFFKDAEVGDKLLIWRDRAVLYSPSKDILLAVWPLNVVPTE